MCVKPWRHTHLAECRLSRHSCEGCLCRGRTFGLRVPWLLVQGTWSLKEIAESACLMSSTVPANLFSSSCPDQLLEQYWKALWVLLGLVAPHRYSSWHLLISVRGQLVSQLSPLALTLLAARNGLRVEADQWHGLAVKPALRLLLRTHPVWMTVKHHAFVSFPVRITPGFSWWTTSSVMFEHTWACYLEYAECVCVGGDSSWEPIKQKILTS